MSDEASPPPDAEDGAPRETEVTEVLGELKRLEKQVSKPEYQDEIRRVRKMLERAPGTKTIDKYTSRDVGEAFVGALLFSLPLLVEDGVFEIAEWFVAFMLGPIPLFLVINTVFIVAVTTGLLYAVDIREVRITNPVFGFIPRRLVGILAVSFICAFGMMFLWGRLHEGDPTTLEAIARITVIWAAAALGAVLADVLPGESKGKDISTLGQE